MNKIKKLNDKRIETYNQLTQLLSDIDDTGRYDKKELTQYQKMINWIDEQIKELIKLKQDEE